MTWLNDIPIVTLVTFLPALGALVIAFTPTSRPNMARYLALGFALAAWVVSLVMLAGFVAGDPAFQFTESLAWIPTFGINYAVGVDGLSIVLVVLTTTLTWISILASFGPIQNRVKEYMISFLVLEVGMTGVFVAMDLFLFYIFWELVLVPMYLIIGIWGGKNRIYATIKFVLYTLVGSLLMLVAILATAFTYQAGHDGSWAGAFDVQALADYAATGAFGGTFGLIAFGAFFLAFAIKVPMFPFHTWLPDAHVEAPTAGSVILAGVLLKLGGYGFIRFALPLFPEAAQCLGPADHRPEPDRDHLRRDRGARPAGPQEAGRVLVRLAHGLRDPGHLRVPAAGHAGRDPADGQPRPDHRRPVPPRGRDLRADPRPHHRQDGRPGRRGPGLRGRLRVLRLRLGGPAGPVRLRGRVPDPGGHVRGQPGRGGRRDVRDDPRRRLPALDAPAGRCSASCRTS